MPELVCTILVYVVSFQEYIKYANQTFAVRQECDSKSL